MTFEEFEGAKLTTVELDYVLTAPRDIQTNGSGHISRVFHLTCPHCGSAMYFPNHKIPRRRTNYDLDAEYYFVCTSGHQLRITLQAEKNSPATLVISINPYPMTEGHKNIEHT